MKEKGFLFCLVIIIMVVDDLVMQGAKASTAMLLA